MKFAPVRYFVKPFVAAVIMGFVVFVVHKLLLPFGNAPATLISILTGGAVYFAFIILLKVFSSEELSAIPVIGKYFTKR